MANKVVTLNATPAANYGQTTNYGPYGTGADGASAEAAAQGEHNKPAEGAVKNAAGYAGDAAKNGTGFTDASQDAGAANNQASGANGNQAGAIELARRQAMGQGPSAAAYQLQAGLDQGLAQQTSMGRSARGGAGLATEQSNAGYNSGAMEQNAFTQGGMLRSQDMAQGRGLYGSLLNDKRGQDANAIGQADQMSQFNSQSNDNYRNQMGNAAVGFGQVQNGQNQNDLNNFNRTNAPTYAQDDMRQQAQEWRYENAQHAAADNKANAG